MIPHVTAHLRQGVPKFAADQTGTWPIAGVVRMPALQSLCCEAENLGDIFHAEKRAEVLVKVGPGAQGGCFAIDQLTGHPLVRFNWGAHIPVSTKSALRSTPNYEKLSRPGSHVWHLACGGDPRHPRSGLRMGFTDAVAEVPQRVAARLSADGPAARTCQGMGDGYGPTRWFVRRSIRGWPTAHRSA